MDTPLVRRSLAVTAALLVVLALALWLWPRRETTVTHAQPVARPAPAVVAVQATPTPEGVVMPVDKEPRKYTLEDFPDLKDAPPNCQNIVLSVRRNVPPWSIEKNMDAQAMTFDEKEMACLNEKGVPDQILVRAENHLRVPQPPSR
jgi:hypothetical protein